MDSRTPDRDVDLDLGHEGEVAMPVSELQITKVKKTGFFSFENPGFVLIIYNFLFALPLSYILTMLNKEIISLVGYEKIMRCPSGIFFSRTLFVAVNMWLVVGWGVQLEREAWEKGGKKRGKGENGENGEKEERVERLERLKGLVWWWGKEVERLEGWREILEQREVEEQILLESPASGNNKLGSARKKDGDARSDASAVSPTRNQAQAAAAKGVDGDGYEVDDSEDVEESEESSGGDEGDSEWNGVD